MRRSTVLIVVPIVVLIAALGAAGPSAAAPTPPLLDARGCLSTVHVFLDDASRVQPRYVPARYTPMGWVPGKAWTALWSFSCDGAAVSGGLVRPTKLAIAAVAIAHPDRQPGEQAVPELPNLWSHYTHLIITDNASLAARLRHEGFPVRIAPDISLVRRAVVTLPPPLGPIFETRVNVPGAWNSWTRAVIPQLPPHSHSNEFWFDGPRGTTALELRIPSATDHFCELAAGGQCGTAAAPVGSPMAQFLGGPERTADAAIDHDKINRVVAFATGH